VLTAVNAGKITDAALLTPSYATTCSGSGSLMDTLGSINHAANQNWLNNDGTVAYTCLLANPAPDSIIINVPAADTESTPVNPTTPAYLTFTWQSQDNTTGDASSCPSTFQPQADWTSNCPYGILRLDIFKVVGGDADATAGSTATVYLLPAASGAPRTAIKYGAPNIVTATCSTTTSTCSATLSDTGDSKFAGQYYVRESNLYRGSGNVVISPSPAHSSTFKDAQILVDVTGKAQDELRRVQERISPKDTVTPESLNAVSSGATVCKRFSVFGSGTSATPASLCQAY